MGFLSLFLVASTPTFQVLLVGLLGAYLASGYSNILTAGARRDINKIVFMVFTPSLMFASLAKTVTLQDIVSWWFMPINVGIIVFLGAFLGWLVVKIFRPERYLEGLIIAYCSAGNFGNLLLIIVPAICLEDGNPFGDHNTCSARGLSYVSFSMAIGGFYIWTHTFGIMKKAARLHQKIQLGMSNGVTEVGNEGSDVSSEACPLKIEGEDGYIDQEKQIVEASDNQNQNMVPLLSSAYLSDHELNFCEKLMRNLRHIVEELMAPPTVAAVIGFTFGAIPWLKHLIIGESAPLRVIQDSIKLLGDGTIPCITLILGGNLTQGESMNTSRKRSRRLMEKKLLLAAFQASRLRLHPAPPPHKAAEQDSQKMKVDEKQKTVLLTEQDYEDAEEILDVKDLYDHREQWASYVLNAIKAKEHFLSDLSYIVCGKEVLIVDEFINRVMQIQSIGVEDAMVFAAPSITVGACSDKVHKGYLAA